MTSQQKLNFERVSAAIRYIHDHFQSQPSLDEIAGHIGISPHHFQRVFSEWAGTSPKKFLQYISLEHAKMLLRQENATLFDAALDSGFSGSSRLHDLFINIEGMTPGEYKNGAENLVIRYAFYETRFGSTIVASTSKGICYLAFEDREERGRELLGQTFPKATLQEGAGPFHEQALQFFRDEARDAEVLKLHLKGTPFQLKVWRTLLTIPSGKLATYGKIAAKIEKPTASRAVGTAIGANPVAYLIPCHRVIRSSGLIGDYRWSPERKAALIGWEAVRAHGSSIPG